MTTKGYIEPYWHEKDLTILLLNKGSLRKHELFDEIRKEQTKRTVLGRTGVAHSTSAYNYWVRKLKSEWIISDRGGVLQLTRLGKWAASSSLEVFLERQNFVNLICSKCAKPGDLFLLKPVPESAETNSYGRLFMDLYCPRCENYIPRMCVSGFRMPPRNVLSDIDLFVQFYNRALRELQGIVSGESLK